MTAIFFDRNIPDDDRRRQLYDGEIFVYSPSKSTIEFCEFAKTMCEEYFHPHAPPEAQHHLPVERYTEILAELKPTFIHHPESKRLIRGILQELNCDLQRTYFDVPRLRTACAGDYLSSGLAYAFKPHRDSWYSTPMCQLNWWLPIYPVESNNVMAFHMNYWDHPVKNSSQEFNYQDWNNRGRKAAHNQGKVDTRRQSEALEEMALEPDLRLVCNPGGLIIFSATQMHSTVPNSSQSTRFSIDFRTVHLDEVETDSGAKNVDGESTGTTMMDYLRGSDLEHFSTDVIDRYAKRKPSAEYPTSAELMKR